MEEKKARQQIRQYALMLHESFIAACVFLAANINCRRKGKETIPFNSNQLQYLLLIFIFLDAEHSIYCVFILVGEIVKQTKSEVVPV